MLLSRDTIADASTVCSAGDFYKPAHGDIFDAIVRLHGQGEPADAVTVAAELRRIELLDRAGGPSALVGLQAATPAMSNAGAYARIVRNNALLRGLIGVAGEIRELGFGGGDADEAIGCAVSLVEGARRGRHAAHDDRGPLDWAELWARSDTASDFLAAPILARGRQHALWSPAKAGKSLFTLWLSAGCATGRPLLDQPAGEPVDVVYIDLEMTEDDLRDRLCDMGYGPASDLSHLHYYLLPALPPLDTPAGGRALLDIAKRHDAQLVVIDTTARVVEGPEDSADTIRAFYRNTGALLKVAGVAVLRLDHGGKDLARGQRGSSSKNDDVDIVYQLTPLDGGIQLLATHRRVGWVPEKLDLGMTTEPLAYHTKVKPWPAGTAELATVLDELGAATDITRRQALELLREHKASRSTSLVGAALHYRRLQAEGERR